MNTYKRLQEEYLLNKIPYSLLLTTQEWANRRVEIIIRDNFTCQKCNQSKELRYPNFLLDERVRGDHSLYLVHKIPLNTTILAEWYNLQIHHKRYVQNWLPWEYEDRDLITYCPDCHRKWHEEHKVKYFALDENGSEREIICQPCDKCNGKGYLSQYSHIENGICFKCSGRTFVANEETIS